MRFVFLWAGILASTAAWAGNWGSSGNGEFMRDQHNPWFVKNVSEVSYCIEVDPAGFSASPEKIFALTEKALSYWKEEFSANGNVLGIGTQEFKFAVKCKGDEDLKFQFGHGTLTPEQLKEFSDHDEDPQNYVGIAMRTEYDKVNLKGKGFIFISSDRGSHPYNAGNGISKNLWSHDGLLFRALQHELGHVFGVAHTDGDFMAADFPENMIRNFRRFRDIADQRFFTPRDAVEICAYDSTIPIKDAYCAGVFTTDQWRSFEISIKTIGNTRVSLGKSSSVKRVVTEQQFPVKVFLPKEQKVFNAAPGELSIRGPARQKFKLLVDFVEADGTTSKLIVDMAPARVEVYKIKNGSVGRWF